MRPLIEKLPLSEDSSFVARTYRTPHFEVPWHQHIEYEIILFLEGEGRCFIGNHVGEFRVGDIYLLGSNLPHTFQKANKEMITSALVVQFRGDCWGSSFLQLPEAKDIRHLLGLSMKGLRMKASIHSKLSPLLEGLEKATGIRRITGLFECLQIIAESGSFNAVSTQEETGFNSRKQERIDRIFRYTIDHFQDPLSLELIAKEADMSIPAFCSWFRKSTKKTYIDFVNEIRIGHACQQLIDTQKTVQEICFESGYNTLANFNKQFLKIKECTPTGIRRKFAARR